MQKTIIPVNMHTNVVFKGRTVEEKAHVACLHFYKLFTVSLETCLRAITKKKERTVTMNLSSATLILHLWRSVKVPHLKYYLHLLVLSA